MCNKAFTALTCYEKKSPPCENFGSLRHAAACFKTPTSSQNLALWHAAACCCRWCLTGRCVLKYHSLEQQAHIKDPHKPNAVIPTGPGLPTGTELVRIPDPHMSTCPSRVLCHAWHTIYTRCIRALQDICWGAPRHVVMLKASIRWCPGWSLGSAGKRQLPNAFDPLFGPKMHPFQGTLDILMDGHNSQMGSRPPLLSSGGGGGQEASPERRGTRVCLDAPCHSALP